MTPYDRDIERFSQALPASSMLVNKNTVANLTVDREGGRVSFELPVETEINPRDYIRVEEAGQHPRMAKVMAIAITPSRMAVEAYMPFRRDGEEV